MGQSLFQKQGLASGEAFRRFCVLVTTRRDAMIIAQAN